MYLPELLPALERAVASLSSMATGLPLAPRDVHAHLLRRCRLFGMKGLLGVALGGLDMALWDAWARARGEPLARALGAEPRPLRAYHSVGLYSAKEVVAIAEETLTAGFAGLKIKAGFATFAEDLAAVRAAKRALGSSTALMIDYNQSLTRPEAMARCKALDDEGLEWIEEPVLADALVMPDAQFIHGVTGWLEASALAHTAGLPMSYTLSLKRARTCCARRPPRTGSKCWTPPAGCDRRACR